MKSKNLLLRVYGEQADGQWSLINLEFSLAAQAHTLEEAKAILKSQIREYISDALTGQDQKHASVLMSRRAPLKYWIKYWISRHFGRAINSTEKAFVEPMPLVLA